MWVNRVLEQAIPAITLENLKEATSEYSELAQILDEKRHAKKSTATSKGPWGKIWDEVHERDGILIRKDKLVIPKSLQAQAIAIAHEGHQQTVAVVPQHARQREGIRGFVQMPDHQPRQRHATHEAETTAQDPMEDHGTRLQGTNGRGP